MRTRCKVILYSGWRNTSIAKEAGNPAFIAATTEKDMDNENRVAGIVDCGADEFYTIPSYTFTGNGNWDVSSNWLNGIIPPNPLTTSAKIYLDPWIIGECLLNINQIINNGVQVRVNPGKAFRISGNLISSN